MDWQEIRELEGVAMAEAIIDRADAIRLATMAEDHGTVVPATVLAIAHAKAAGSLQAAVWMLCGQIQRLRDEAKQPADIRAALQAHQAQMKPETGADFILVEFGGTSVLVEYELDDDDAELCGSLADSIRLLGLLVNGQWTDIDDTAANTRDRWVKAIVSKIEAENDRAKADLYISAGVV